MTGVIEPDSPQKNLVASTEQDLQRGLKNRHIQLIALGGAIGTGLFYGAGESISMAGPAILLAYLMGGIVIFFIMRALGEMSVDNPVSGAFSHYAYENLGPFAGFFSGWNYWFNYIAVSMAELVVVGTYVQFWFPSVPTWVSSAVFLIVITLINLVGVKAYGEFEFWFAIIKVVAIIAMIIFGLGIIFFDLGSGEPTGISNIWKYGGFFATDAKSFAMALVVVLFSFGGVELVGITAGEAADPQRSIPKAINQVVYRILLFYIGSIFVMLAIFPWNQLGKGESPFVSIFSKLGIASAATILNVVVLTAAVSAYNSGLYCNGRMLKALAEQGNAPAVLAKVNKSGSPWVGVLVSSLMTTIAVLLVYLMPGTNVFLYVISVALVAGIFNWAMIMVTQLRFRQRRSSDSLPLAFKLPLYPVINYVVLAFLAGVYILMIFNPKYQLAATIIGPLWIVLLAAAYGAKKLMSLKT
ncbi:MAG: amino acid permease [Propionibacteriaceae bacterium]